MEIVSLLENVTQLRVSSVLNKEVQSYGKQFLIDDSDETSWCSSQGSPQWISLNFNVDVKVSSIKLQFQGGFAGKECQVALVNKDKQETVIRFYPEDNNLFQTFKIDSSFVSNKVIINFHSSTDFFGRIIVYKLDILGEKC